VIEKGELQFDKLTICYRPGLPPVLRDLCFNVQAGEKIGIVGRTGAGKSTIVGSILRLVEAAAGAVLVDGKRTSELSVRDLRSSITLIAQ
jgi:ATP-binding cassette subfamily C (CFTR/MRP) protein 1